MKKLIIIRGPLGVGKTTVAQILSQNLHLEYLSLDKIVEDNHLVPPDAEGIPLESYLKANDIIFALAEKTENSVLVDGCFYYQEQLDELVKKFDNNVAMFTLTSHVEKCIERDFKRPKVYGEDAARFVHMVTSKIQVGHEVDNTDLTVEETVEQIMKKM